MCPDALCEYSMDAAMSTGLFATSSHCAKPHHPGHGKPVCHCIVILERLSGRAPLGQLHLQIDLPLGRKTRLSWERGLARSASTGRATGWGSGMLSSHSIEKHGWISRPRKSMLILHLGPNHLDSIRRRYRVAPCKYQMRRPGRRRAPPHRERRRYPAS